jgi:hypothetical protein
MCHPYLTNQPARETSRLGTSVTTLSKLRYSHGSPTPAIACTSAVCPCCILQDSMYVADRVAADIFLVSYFNVIAANVRPSEGVFDHRLAQLA